MYTCTLQVSQGTLKFHNCFSMEHKIIVSFENRHACLASSLGHQVFYKYMQEPQGCSIKVRHPSPSQGHLQIFS